MPGGYAPGGGGMPGGYIPGRGGGMPIPKPGGGGMPAGKPPPYPYPGAAAYCENCGGGAGIPYSMPPCCGGMYAGPAANPDAAMPAIGPCWYAIDSGDCLGPVANSVLGRLCEAMLARCCAASKRSAGVPCRSPLVSFLNAYPTEMARLQRNCPFMASMAASLASKQS